MDLSPKLCSIKNYDSRLIFCKYWQEWSSFLLLLQNWFPLKQKLTLIKGWDQAEAVKPCQHGTVFTQTSVVLECWFVLWQLEFRRTKNLGSEMSWPWIPSLEGMSAWLGRCHHLLSERYFKVSCNVSTLQFTGFHGHHCAVDWQGAWPRSNTEEIHSCVLHDIIA